MAYTKLNLKNGEKLNATHLAHIESGIAANETELAKKAAKSDIPDVSGLQPKGDYALKKDVPDVSNLQPKGDYALKKDIPDVSNFATHTEVQELIDAIEMPEGTSGMIALTEEEILNICKF